MPIVLNVDLAPRDVFFIEAESGEGGAVVRLVGSTVLRMGEIGRRGKLIGGGVQGW